MTQELAPISGAAALVSRGEAILKIENDTFMRVATERPRDEASVLRKALAELEFNPDAAAAAYYSIPYQDRASGKETFVEGPSIKAAMTLFRRWGNCTCRAIQVGEDATGINLEGRFIDAETNTFIGRPQRVARYIVRRNGSIQELDPARLQTAFHAGASKAIRSAILAGIPEYISQAYFHRAKELVAGGKLADKPAPAQIEKIHRAFGEAWSISLLQLEAKIGRLAAEWTNEDVVKLRGLYTAITEKEITAEEAFGLKPSAEPATGREPEQTTLDAVAESLEAPGRLIADCQTLITVLELSGGAERTLAGRVGIVGSWKMATAKQLLAFRTELVAVYNKREEGKEPKDPTAGG